MNILGISAHYHDSAAALLVDGLPLAAVQEERLSRKKNDAAFPLAAIDWCLAHAGLEPEALDAVVFYEKPLLKFERVLITALLGFPRSWKSWAPAMKNLLGEKMWMRGIISAHLGVDSRRVLFTEHHQGHAAISFFGSPETRAAILISDGVGEWATLSIGHGRRDGAGSDVTLTREVRFPHSLGLVYSAFTAYLGFAINDGEYKLMGLAAYGEPRYADRVRQLVRRRDDGAFALDLSFFEFQHSARRAYSDRFVALFGPPRKPHEPIDLDSRDGRRYADCAASVQCVVEEILLSIARELRRDTGLDALCLGGGVALNGLANARLLRESGFARVHVPSAPGDAGCALGAALYADRIHFGNPDREWPAHAYFGPVLDADELGRLAAEDGLAAQVLDEARLLDTVAGALAAGGIVGWMEGALEFGPRALGHRSILAAPHDAALRDRLNREIKFREPFRPFAPVVRAADAERYFELPPGGACLGRYMSGVFKVRREWRERLAAVTHVDGSARVQVLEPDTAPRLHRLLDAYARRSGIAVLLNTSFNLSGEPIVNRVAEGYLAFRRCGMDALVADNWYLRRPREPETPR